MSCWRWYDGRRVQCSLDTDAYFRKLKVLNEFYGTLDVFADGALSLGLGCAFTHEPIGMRRIQRPLPLTVYTFTIAIEIYNILFSLLGVTCIQPTPQ
jgi:hypothetical protein